MRIKYEIIIVDDCCPENSGHKALIRAKNKKIKVFFHKANLGYGAAIRTGFKKVSMMRLCSDGMENLVTFNDLPKILKAYKTV